jgi:hypothetical protein
MLNFCADKFNLCVKIIQALNPRKCAAVLLQWLGTFKCLVFVVERFVDKAFGQPQVGWVRLSYCGSLLKNISGK